MVVSEPKTFGAQGYVQALGAREAYYQATWVIQAAQAWAEANRDRKNESRRKRYVSAGGHRQAKTREYAAIRAASGKTAAYRDATREEHRAWSRNRSAAVTESYAREQLAKGSQLAAKDFPEAIVHAKQALIKLKRELK